MKKKVGRQIMILIMGPIMGLIALLCVYYLPVTRMKENIYWSLDTITAEFDNETINEQIQNIAQKKDTLCRRMYN